MEWNKLSLDPNSKKIYDLYLKKDKPLLIKLFTKTQNELLDQIDIVRELLQHAKNNNSNDIITIWNVIGYITMLSLDLKTYMKLLIKQDSGYDKVALLRILILYLFEGIDDIHDLTGRSFSKTLIELKINPVFLKELKEAKKKFTDFKNEYYEDLKVYRNTVGAHRDFDFQKYTQLIIKTEETSIIKIVTIFDSLLNDFSKVIDKILKESTELKKKLLESGKK